ncbi:unnamed protein product [Boreogadus saida]
MLRNRSSQLRLGNRDKMFRNRVGQLRLGNRTGKEPDRTSLLWNMASMLRNMASLLRLRLSWHDRMKPMRRSCCSKVATRNGA